MECGPSGSCCLSKGGRCSWSPGLVQRHPLLLRPGMSANSIPPSSLSDPIPLGQALPPSLPPGWGRCSDWPTRPSHVTSSPCLLTFPVCRRASQIEGSLLPAGYRLPRLRDPDCLSPCLYLEPGSQRSVNNAHFLAKLLN